MMTWYRISTRSGLRWWRTACALRRFNNDAFTFSINRIEIVIAFDLAHATG